MAEVERRNDDEPRWCCAILRDSRGWYVLERRPLTDADAPGRLTCFGGTRERGEEPATCLARELVEELGFVIAGALERAVVLHTGVGEAWFYRAAGPEEGACRALEEGHEAVWHDPALGFASVAMWNRLAIEAERRGEVAAWVPVSPRA